MLYYTKVTIVDPTDGSTYATTDVAIIEGFTRYVAGADGVIYRLTVRTGRHALDEARGKIDDLCDGATVAAKPLAARYTDCGYTHHLLTDDDGKRHEIRTHRIIASAFIGPVDGMVVDHLNFVRDDNRACNLQVITQRENCIRSISAGRCPQLRRVETA